MPSSLNEPSICVSVCLKTTLGPGSLRVPNNIHEAFSQYVIEILLDYFRG